MSWKRTVSGSSKADSVATALKADTLLTGHEAEAELVSSCARDRRAAVMSLEESHKPSSSEVPKTHDKEVSACDAEAPAVAGENGDDVSARSTCGTSVGHLDGVQGGRRADPAAYRCLVPQEALGLLAGIGGARLRELSLQTGAKVAISGESDTPESLSDRVLSIRGDSIQKEAACMRVVERLFEAQNVELGGHGIFVMLVPAACASAVANLEPPAVPPDGGGGADESLEAWDTEASAAEVDIDEAAIAGTDDQPVRIFGTLSQTAAAAVAIAKLVEAMFSTPPSPAVAALPVVSGRGRRLAGVASAAGVAPAVAAPPSVASLGTVRAGTGTRRRLPEDGTAPPRVWSSGTSAPCLAATPAVWGRSPASSSTSTGGSIATPAAAAPPARRRLGEATAPDGCTALAVPAALATWAAARGRMLRDLRATCGAEIQDFGKRVKSA